MNHAPWRSVVSTKFTYHAVRFLLQLRRPGVGQHTLESSDRGGAFTRGCRVTRGAICSAHAELQGLHRGPFQNSTSILALMHCYISTRK